MEYFDVLVKRLSTSDEYMWHYDVFTIQAKNLDTAYKTARRRVAKDNFSLCDVERCVVKLVGVKPAGEYDNFIGKYVGQFIDEALLRQS